MEAEDVGHRRRPANHRQLPFVEILERLRSRCALYFPHDGFRGVGSLLHGHLGHALQWLSLGIQRQREVSDYVNVWIIGNREVGIYFDSSSLVRLGFCAVRQSSSQRRNLPTSSPNDCSGVQAIGAVMTL